VRVFHQSAIEPNFAVTRMRTNLEQKKDDKAGEIGPDSALAVYHDAPLQIAAILAGASQRLLTEDELIAYEALLGEGKDLDKRPSREEILKAYTSVPQVH